jgi:hypothetical protein
MIKNHLNESILILIVFLILLGCENKDMKIIDLTDFRKLNFQENIYTVEVLEYYPFTGSKLFSNNWSNIYLCKEVKSKDTILLFEIKKDVPAYISERKIVRYLIFRNDLEKCPLEISVNYPGRIEFLMNFKVVCAKLGYLYD